MGAECVSSSGKQMREDRAMYRIYRRENGSGVPVQHSVTAEGNVLEYLTFPSLEGLPVRGGRIRHLITTRLGGVSQGEFARMNFSVDRGDRPEAVLANYGRIGKVLGCGPEDMVASHQTHTTNIRRVTGEDRGKGVVRPRDYENIDGLITDEKGIALVTFYADCVPLLFADPSRGAVGLAHSGWRGTVNRMGECMVRAMADAFGSRPQELYAAVGPSICRDCYEVSGEVAGQFTSMLGSRVAVPGKQEDKFQLDLWLANMLILEEAGIPGNHIAVTDICTCHNKEYLFSHRASGGRRGNIGVFLMLQEI